MVKDPGIEQGDHAIIFPTENGDKAALGPGSQPSVGQHIAIHETVDGDIVTHGKSELHQGDEVIIVHTKDGDQVALRSGKQNPILKCKVVPHGYGDESMPHSPPDDTYQYHATNIILSRPVYPEELLNVVLKFGPQADYGGVQPWYPYGGVWIGVSEDSESWYWAGGNPYMFIRGQPVFHCDPDSMPLAGFKRDGGRTWCIYNFMELFYPIGQANWPVNYIHVHISQQSSLFFYNRTRTSFSSAHLCSGPVGDGWCDVLKLI
ncbi:hypothetical protein [Methanobacterium sp.]|uniref:hypothetical protein n=1 Tax=Methanobacterium sp. TaxID=2164 RepID=UPI002ABBA5AC|nr:hypothetical protein [Methanobacterium sp.]MDY9922804.1 hypothetical protein [Methanobacterium sp.]